jgi:hypothetical protein
MPWPLPDKPSNLGFPKPVMREAPEVDADDVEVGPALLPPPKP